jgi:hypothetical protein
MNTSYQVTGLLFQWHAHAGLAVEPRCAITAMIKPTTQCPAQFLIDVSANIPIYCWTLVISEKYS